MPFPLVHVALATGRNIVCQALQRFDALAAPCPTKVLVGRSVASVSTTGDEHLKFPIPAKFSKVFRC